MCAPPFTIFSIDTLGERKANVKYDFRFALLSPHASSGAKPRRDIPEKELLARSPFLLTAIGARRISLIAHGARSLSWQAEHPGIDSRRNPLVTPCVFSNKTHPGGMVSSASARGPV